jgi:hypothetical protein
VKTVDVIKNKSEKNEENDEGKSGGHRKVGLWLLVSGLC